MTPDEPEPEVDSEAIQMAAERLRAESLEPITPEEGLDHYLHDKRSEYAQSTIETHESRLRWFVDYCAQEKIENLNDLTGRDIHRFRLWRREEGDLCTVSEKHSQDTVRSFIRFLVSIDAVPPGLIEKVVSPSLSQGEDVRDDYVARDRVNDILGYLRKYKYASREHAVWSLFGRTGMRLGTLRALDIPDYNPDAEPPHIDINHSPGETPLKNQHQAERLVWLSLDTCGILNDFLADHHPEVEDEFGRVPLIGTEHGRVADSTIRRYVYKWTRPCVISGTCPHERDLNSCQAASNGHYASRCPSSKSPHNIRRGYITQELEEGVPKDIICDRADVTEPVLREYYDQRSEQKKMSQRKDIINSAHQEDSVHKNEHVQ